ncbi:MAG TPA: histidine--tRNA ligase [Thermomicrobiales bacterium]|nr:histidine--tRNA ligase [Thermomicrobiales bacterium]
MSSRKPSILKGFRDYTPDQMRLRLQVIGIFRTIFERHGFEPIDTPALEYMEILTGKAGENEKLMYHFLDQGEREVGLRYDLTVPLARYVAMHQQESVLPFKRYHIAPVWRAEKPQRGRFREFWQCDADIVGSPSMLADAEAVSILTEALAAVNLPNAVVLINHRKLLEAMALLAGVDAERAGGVFRAIDKLAKIGPDGVKRDLIATGIDEIAANRVIELATRTGTPQELLGAAERDLEAIPGGVEAVSDLRDLVVALDEFGVSPASWKIDLSLARGIDYYTGPVFEATVEEPKIGSVAGAGRYDHLVGTFLGRDIPATGMSLGMERILDVIQEFGLLPRRHATAAVVIPVLPDTLREASRLANELRGAGINVDLSLLANRSLGDQLKVAARRGIPWAIIAGPDEISRDVALIRDLTTGEQREVARDGIVDEAKRTVSR